MKKLELFDVINYFVLGTLAVICALPLVHVLAVSLSDSSATNVNAVILWPVGFHLNAYAKILGSRNFYDALTVSVVRTILGTLSSMVIIAVTAYPLSKSKEEFQGRNLFTWFFFFTMLFSGGLVPYFLQIRNIGLLDNFWVLIIPSIMNVFNMIILMNCFRQLPASLLEAAEIDGAHHFLVFTKICLPLSMPTLATLALFSMVFHWNDWFTGMILLFDPKKWPLQTYIRALTLPNASIEDLKRLSGTDIAMMRQLSDKNFKAAQLFIATIPILCSYPFLQKYFVKGIIVGSIKG